MSSNKPTSRFLPTLTEVVLPTPPANSVTQDEDQLQLVERVTERAVAAIQDHLQPTLQSVMDEHLQILTPRLQEEMARVVRLAVCQALAEKNIAGS